MPIITFIYIYIYRVIDKQDDTMFLLHNIFMIRWLVFPLSNGEQGGRETSHIFPSCSYYSIPSSWIYVSSSLWNDSLYIQPFPWKRESTTDKFLRAWSTSVIAQPATCTLHRGRLLRCSGWKNGPLSLSLSVCARSKVSRRHCSATTYDT